MAYFKIQPPGMSPLGTAGRKPIVRVIGGDTWPLSVSLYDPVNPSEPATPENSIVRVVLAETQFDNPLWVGEWHNGVTQDSVRKTLHHIKIPASVTKSLRRGSYQFSIRVSDPLKTRYVTEAEGAFLVEYKPTSEQHSIPYKDGTSGDTAAPADRPEFRSEVAKVVEAMMRGRFKSLDPENTTLYELIKVLKGE